MRHQADASFWALYNRLSPEHRRDADKAYALLKANPFHPSLHFKKVGRFWSARVTLNIRAVAVEKGPAIVWIWIGTHREYERFIKGG